ncbi:MAG: hypothetical protein QOE59_5238 [Actinomycetota bacterium]|jgi:2-polyprenyl-6-methoxyphenol hydroxylase-like FAD-dependent oxidoreductase|nr:hypothetical protein [Actinomycetota bacterium]
MNVVIVGGSAAGLLAALLLARADHEVTIFDADDLEPAADVEAAAAAAFRPAAPQIVQPHALLPRFRELLRHHLPDVHAALLTAGVMEAPLTASMPHTLTDRAPRDGDERLTMMLTRRSTVDWVLRRVAAIESRVTLRHATRVIGLLARPGTPPHVHGVETDTGPVPADLVVDASGRRTHLDTWLKGIDSVPTVLQRAECGLAYYGRHYRIRTSAALPGPHQTRILLALDEFTTGLWCGDNKTLVFAVAPLLQDKRFRPVTQPHVFDAVLRTVPPFVPWLDIAEPTTGVHAMGGLHNTLRQLVRDERPVATGLAALGDTACTTNPTFGRGLTLALLHALDLLECTVQHADDPAAFALAMHKRGATSVAPFYADQAANDAARLAQLRHRIAGDAPPARIPVPQAVDFAELRMAAMHDPDLLRAFWTVMGMLRPPRDVYHDPAVVKRTREVLAGLDGAAPMPQPNRHDLEAALLG